MSPKALYIVTDTVSALEYVPPRNRNRSQIVAAQIVTSQIVASQIVTAQIVAAEIEAAQIEEIQL